MRALITGGAGFVGSHLADDLIERGHAVHLLDDLSTGRRANIDHLSNHPEVTFTRGSIDRIELLTDLMETTDVVFHLAAAVGVFLIVDRPVETIETNITGTRTVLKAAEDTENRLLLASSSEVYGKSTNYPYHEEDDMVLGPSSQSRWSYACSKAVDEFLGLSYHDERNMPVVIARLFNTVGPRQVGQYGMVVPRFVQQALDGGPITVYGTGEQRRAFAHVRDVTDGLISLVRSDDAAGRVFNIGNDEETRIIDLARTIRDRVNPEVSIKKIPYEEAYEEGFEDLERRVPDLSRIRETIDYTPRRPLDDILDDVIAHQKQLRG